MKTGRTEPVFDITVPLHHAYYANGVLTSNSDGFRGVALVAKHSAEMTRKPAAVDAKPPARSLDTFKLDDLWDTAPDLGGEGRL